MNIEKLVRKQDWIYEKEGRDWRDGLLLGNGDLCAIASAPGHLEWVINKVDVFDPTNEKEMVDKMIPHSEFLEKIRDMEPKNTMFLEELENGIPKGKRQRDTMSCAILRMSFWYGIGWSAPPMPTVKRRLSLYEGTLYENVRAHNINKSLTMFIPRGYETICMRLTGPAAKISPNILELVRPADERLEPPHFHTIDNETIAFTQKLPGKKGSYAIVVSVQPKDGSTPSANGAPGPFTHNITSSNDVDIFVTVKSSFSAKEPLEEALDELKKVRSLSFESLHKLHLAQWKNYWDAKGYADFGKYKKIQSYYTFGLYEMACVYGKAPMPGLNGMGYGPLNEKIPGVGCQGYCHDQNAQIPVMALLPSNRIELVNTVADTYLNMAKELKKKTRKLFKCDGIYIPLCCNQLGLEYPTKTYRYTLCGSAYTGMVLSFAWKYSRNLTLLREKLYPLLREFVIFYSHLMHKGEDGRYHLDWSVPPEIFTLTRDELSTISMLKVSLETVIEGAKLLKKDGKLLPKWEDLLANYPLTPTRPDGAFWGGPDLPLNHFFYGGHTLYPFFPAAITEDKEAALKTLSFIENAAIERSFADKEGEIHMNHDWSEFITTSARLRAGLRKASWEGVERFLKLFAKENGLFSHDPILFMDVEETERNEKARIHQLHPGQIDFTGNLLDSDSPHISHALCATENTDAKRLAPAVQEGNLAFVFLASETLLQSNNGKIKLFPGVPEDFTGSFKDLLAEGGFLVSAKMRNGKILSCRVKSLYGGSFILVNGGNKKITLEKGKVYKAQETLSMI